MTKDSLLERCKTDNDERQTDGKPQKRKRDRRTKNRQAQQRKQTGDNENNRDKHNDERQADRWTDEGQTDGDGKQTGLASSDRSKEQLDMDLFLWERRTEQQKAEKADG